ncbi:hypothetical protein RS130_00485 [Paraglaciecola aquimarina]|uniref:Uncharacterized protein n=1 Tax=Paraglaciecola aquimarina TaxID=1235557 RepID=A0ABU3SRF5_9ALTE|nr:hypothetical protein [Paraglaciecola aquimarina]MDU0352588.1 hypothetical protein [Paraglaciecola aquimarina]
MRLFIISDKTLGVTVRKNDDVMTFVIDTNTLQTILVEKTDLYPPLLEQKNRVADRLLLQDPNAQLEHSVFKGVGDLSNNGGQYYLSWHSQPEQQG